MTFSILDSARAEPVTTAPLLSLEDVRIDLRPGVPLVEALSFDVAPGEALAIVGESGCGKSLTSLAVMGLLPKNLKAGQSGKIVFEGMDLAAASEGKLRGLRGNRLAMIFQDPLSALNPVLSVGAQIAEVLTAHARMSKAQAKARAIELLGEVGLPRPDLRFGDYPHQLSGGMRQRVTIAMAIACDPKLVIADEPTTALDVTVQAQILDLLTEIRKRTGQSLILITHDLGVVGEVADRMIVMYAGTVVEEGPVAEVLSRPKHPYTAGLLAARPSGSYVHGGQALSDIPGTVPAPDARPEGCLFAPRCARATDRCREARPPLDRSGPRAVRCFFPVDGALA
ncbi:ABC transporter ATP-binding protein [Salipiger abyssi]|uniref:ABC transporter ATP-binding protein n=1 Tax=Salipiger abyssi TaxID=1250539 RepID=UPI004058B032